MPNICHYVGGLEDDLLDIGELAKNFSLAFQPGLQNQAAVADKRSWKKQHCFPIARWF